MKKSVRKILEESRSAGWVIEPLAREVLKAYMLPVTRSRWARTVEEALAAARRIGYPVVAKIVSPDVVHKSEEGGVVTGIRDDDGMRRAYGRLSAIKGFAGVLVDETASGLELFVGAKHDPQFGPVVLAGIGGTSVEIYRDVAVRMAPLSEKAAMEALHSLKGSALLRGYRGGAAVSTASASRLLSAFSRALIDMADSVESIDLNPVFCGSRRAVIADARIMLKK